MFIGIRNLTAAAVLMVSLVGCGANNSRATHDSSYKAQTYQKDGYLGITSVNPNDPLNPTYHHYEDDTGLMKAVLAQLPGIDKAIISINGPIARVKIKPKPELTDAQVNELRSQVETALDTNMPRYNVKVKMER
ncbi:hypothetical protein GK047_16465 [Paenibacillus sp. SYP-B3998]|uniref:Sporulation protein n=1 Tax=Paenibacillus sp. SYP-B3998 TaxID=2678564 RepID=A0A6G3ZZN8_9BACL|nr:hypothetical protein [Paenibacillus sp. SYP-B3998]NEW07602.1 hypothetical protein [Paenibacillus sp. SYP-B3998]